MVRALEPYQVSGPPHCPLGLCPEAPPGPFRDSLNSFAIDLLGLLEEKADGLGRVGWLLLWSHLRFTGKLVAHSISQLIISTGPSLPCLEVCRDSTWGWGAPLQTTWRHID